MKEKKEKINKVDVVEKQSFLARWFSPLRNKKPRTDNKFFGFMQQLGGTFMLPVACLSVAGVLLGLGSGLQSIVTEDVSKAGYNILGFVSMFGEFFFAMLPLAFTVAIPVGLASKNGGTVAFAAVVAYFGHLAGMNFIISVMPTSWYDIFFNSAGITADKIKLIKSMFGYQNVMDMSILGSIINGLIVWKLNEKLQDKKVPTFIAFFGGKRLTPAISILIFPIMGALYVFTWPWIAKVLYYMGIGFTYLGDFGPGLFIFTSRLLCPTGLHHMLNSLFNYTAVGGVHEITDPLTGLSETFYGNVNAMQAYVKYGLEIPKDVAKWLTGSYALGLFFGLPAAAMAIYFTAKKEQRPVIKAAIISGIIATVGGGITETIEFLFLFVAPLLYLFHAAMVALGYIVFALCGAQIGMGGDVFVYIIYGPIQGIYTKWWLVFIFGPFWAAAYYCVFYFSILKFDIKTIGRGETSDKNLANLMGTESKTEKENKKVLREEITANGVLELIGGWENIDNLTNCFSRLRITLKEPRTILDEDVKVIGAVGLRKISDLNYQIVIGAQVEVVRNFMENKK